MTGEEEAPSDLETVPADVFGRALSGVRLNLLVRDVGAEVAFATKVPGCSAHRISAGFAILQFGDMVIQPHADATYHSNPLLSLMPEAGARGTGVEIRLHEADPDAAVARAVAAGAMVLRVARDRPHGLREAYLLSPSGYAFVPSRRIGG